MTGTKSIVGVLSIMMASGTIADFDVFELDSEVHNSRVVRWRS